MSSTSSAAIWSRITMSLVAISTGRTNSWYSKYLGFRYGFWFRVMGSPVAPLIPPCPRPAAQPMVFRTATSISGVASMGPKYAALLGVGSALIPWYSWWILELTAGRRNSESQLPAYACTRP